MHLSNTIKIFYRKMWHAHCINAALSREATKSDHGESRLAKSCRHTATDAPAAARSGPLGEVCNECNHNVAGHGIFTHGEKILDAITIAETLNKSHKPAMADHPCRPSMDKMKPFGILQTEFVAERMQQNTKDPVLKERFVTDATNQLKAMLKQSGNQRQQECVGQNMSVMSSEMQSM